MAKKIDAYIKLQVPAGQANPSPPVGPALGQHGVNIMEFCKTFNGRSWGYFNYPPGNTKGSIYTAYQYINNDTRYTFLFYTKMNSEIRDQIMETLEISF